ncbi:uncharacterized protein [Cicer arietinum]|uniref:Uncharacterized protein LOC113787732 n=1 Tax=Cicer arietinum TaxID=3827 RepID=A0A3Q7XGL5_CICAR|nr:uncharacterized protein LOC113787732 [Cicer arietinum]
MAPYEALYEHKCQTILCWYKNGESMIVGPEMVQYREGQEDKRENEDLARPFEQGDLVFLRVAPTTGVGRAIKSRKLTSKFIKPYQITARTKPVVYQIALPPILSNIHDVFHMSQLRKYISDPSQVNEPNTIQLKENLSFEVY